MCHNVSSSPPMEVIVENPLHRCSAWLVETCGQQYGEAYSHFHVGMHRSGCAVQRVGTLCSCVCAPCTSPLSHLPFPHLPFPPLSSFAILRHCRRQCAVQYHLLQCCNIRHFGILWTFALPLTSPLHYHLPHPSRPPPPLLSPGCDQVRRHSGPGCRPVIHLPSHPPAVHCR